MLIYYYPRKNYNVKFLQQVHSEWRRNDEQFTTISNITLASVGKEQHNATIACVVSHPALRNPVPVPLKLNIECKYTNIDD